MPSKKICFQSAKSTTIAKLPKSANLLHKTAKSALSTLTPVWRNRIILILIRFQDVKTFVTDPDQGLTLIRIYKNHLN